jgi:hypothetical protein
MQNILNFTVEFLFTITDIPEILKVWQLRKIDPQLDISPSISYSALIP